MFGPQLVVPFGETKVWLWEEVYHQGKVLRVQRLKSLLVPCLCFVPVAQDVRVLGPMSADYCFLPAIMDSSLLELLAPINSSIHCLGHGVLSQQQKSN